MAHMWRLWREYEYLLKPLFLYSAIPLIVLGFFLIRRKVRLKIDDQELDGTPCLCILLPPLTTATSLSLVLTQHVR